MAISFTLGKTRKKILISDGTPIGKERQESPEEHERWA